VDIERILVPTDFSRSSRSALEHAVELARRYGARIVLLHAWKVPSLLSAGRTMELMLEDSARVALEAAARGAGTKAIEVRLVQGEPVEAILQEAKRGCDLLIMGAHRMVGVERALVHNVVDRVLRSAPCPVLTVRSRAS
jgi:nucleotide-binding universal stress UspA family protein